MKKLPLILLILVSSSIATAKTPFRKSLDAVLSQSRAGDIVTLNVYEPSQYNNQKEQVSYYRQSGWVIRIPKGTVEGTYQYNTVGFFRYRITLTRRFEYIPNYYLPQQFSQPNQPNCAGGT